MHHAASDVDSHPATLAQALSIGENFEMLPKDDVARVQRWVDAQNEEMPPHVRDEIRIELDVDARS